MRKWNLWMEHGKRNQYLEELVGNNLLNQEAVIEGAVHSIRNMGDVAFIILRRRKAYSRQSMKMKWQMFPFMN